MSEKQYKERDTRTHHLPKGVEHCVPLIDNSKGGVKVDFVRWELDACRIETLVEVELLLFDALVSILHHVGSRIVGVEVRSPQFHLSELLLKLS